MAQKLCCSKTREVSKTMNVGHPFRRSRSKSIGGANQAPRKATLTGMYPPVLDDENHIFESEAKVFHEPRLDRHDDNAAIEILLAESKLPNIGAHTKTLETVHRVTEGRKPGSFLNRLFRGSLRRPLAGNPPTIRTIPEGRSVDLDCDEWNHPPNPPSIDQQAPSLHDLSTTVKMSNHRVRSADHDFDTFSCMSDLSGSKATTIYTPPPSTRRPLRDPLKLDRHESLGMTSIQDVRNTLKVMERQLDKAAHNGERVSRQKVMNALFTVADSLEDLEERELLRKDLERHMKATSSQIHINSITRYAKEEHPYSDYEDKENAQKRATISTPSSSSQNTTSANDSPSPFNIFTSVGKMFSISDDDKKAVDNALDDLLWTEFVAKRKDVEESGGQKVGVLGQKSRNVMKTIVPRKTVLEVKETPAHSKALSGKENGRIHPSKSRAAESNTFQPFALPWWGATMPAPRADKHGEVFSSSSSSSWDEDEDLKIDHRELDEYGDDDDDDDDEDEDTTDSEENLEYLPDSITVRKPGHSREESKQQRPPYAFSRNKSFVAAATPVHTRYPVRMVDTESRMGFEMGSP